MRFVRSDQARTWRPWLATALWLAIATSCAGDGCTCVNPIPDGFPPEERVANRMQVRISQTGLSALTADPGALIEGFAGELVLDIPPACGSDDNPQICCDDAGNPIGPCGPIDIDLQQQSGDPPRLELTPVQGQSRVDVVVRARVRTLNPLPIIYDSFLGEAECDVSIDSTASGSPSLRVVTDMSLVPDPVAGTTRLEVGDLQIEDFGSGDLDIDGGILCDIADLLSGLFVGTLIGTFEDEIRDVLTEQVCKACPSGDVGECGAFADACDSGVCMRGGECVQELGIAGRIPAASTLGELSPGTLGALDLYEVAGGYADTDQGGISLGFLGGAQPGSAERCGPTSTPPPRDPVSPSPFFAGNTRPDTGAPFDVAIGVHHSNLDAMAWSAYEGGFLCLNVGSRSIDLLNSDTMSLFMRSLNDLLHGDVAQIVLGVRPQKPPVIALGAGTFQDDGNGGQTVDEPLLDVQFPDLDVDFFAMVDDQFVRIMTLTSDVALPINLDVNGAGELVPVTGDLGEAFTNLRVSNAEALQETPDELASRFPALLDIAIPMVADSLGSFALPELGNLAVRIDPDGITSVENNQFLAIFGSFELLPQTLAATAHVDTTAAISRAHIPTPEAFARAVLDPAERPTFELDLGGARADGSSRELEWSIRVNRGLWSPFSRSSRVTVSRPSLWLQGRHEIEVRAREVGNPATADPTPVTLTPIIDVTPPRAVVSRALGSVWLLGTDNVSKGKLRGRVAAADGPWHDVAVPSEIDVLDLLDRQGTRDLGASIELAIELVDESGNVASSQVTLSTDELLTGRTHGGAGCAIAADPDSGAPIGLFLLVLGWVAIRLRRRRAALRAVAIAAVIAAGLSTATGCSGCGDAACEDADAIPPGATGRWNSIAASPDRVAIAAYDERFGDLVLLDVASDGAVQSRKTVDGVPDLEPTFATCAYRGGVMEDGEDVGAYTSLALAGQTALIAYQDIERGQLKFAFEDGDSFVTHTVDPGDGGVAGLYNALALGPDGLPAIAYMVTGVDATGGEPGTKASHLRFAQASVATPSDPSDWTITVIEETAISCAGLCGEGEACIDQGGLRCVTPTDDCAADCGDDACVAGACVAQLAQPAFRKLPEGTGLFANLGYLPDGRAIVVYYDRANTDLAIQVLDGAWTKTALDSRAGADTGMWADMAIDRAGVVHIAYQDALADRLHYLNWSDGAIGPVELVDDGRRADDRHHPVGASAAVFLDSAGAVSVAYQDGLTSDLVLARRDGSTWNKSDLTDGPALYGFFVHAASTESGSWVVSYLYDRESRVLGELLVSPIP